MKINELTGVKKLKTYGAGKTVADMRPYSEDTGARWNKFIEELEELGFKKLGKGAQGVAFEKPGYPWIIKVFKNDTPYMTYLEYARAHQEYSGVPKIKGKYIPIAPAMKIFAVRLEKLYLMNYDEYKQLFDLLYRIRSRANREKNQEVIDEISEKYPTIGQVLKTMPWSDLIDLHQMNVMKRADGTIVVTDPLA